jgi:hypothetical protein
MTESFKQARDEVQSNLNKYEYGLDKTRAWEGFVLGADWAYGWREEERKKKFKTLNDRFDRDQAIIKRLKEALEKLKIMSPSAKYRWVANYTYKDCINDIDLLRSTGRKYFDNEKDALEFVENNKHKGKPFYWQPQMHKEVEVMREVYEWKPI